jgi:hypothetical protein
MIKKIHREKNKTNFLSSILLTDAEIIYREEIWNLLFLKKRIIDCFITVKESSQLNNFLSLKSAHIHITLCLIFIK